MFEPYVKHSLMSPIHLRGTLGCFFLARKSACHRRLRKWLTKRIPPCFASASPALPEPGSLRMPICFGGEEKLASFKTDAIFCSCHAKHIADMSYPCRAALREGAREPSLFQPPASRSGAKGTVSPMPNLTNWFSCPSALSRKWL